MQTKCPISTALSKDGGFRMIFLDSTAAVEELRNIHKLSRTMTAALGRSATACAIMGKMLKEEGGSVTLRIDGGGPAGKIVCVADCGGNVRACCDNPSVELPANAVGKLDVGGAVGKEGSVYVVKDLGFGEPYVGFCKLVSGEIAEDITEYFTVSEQTPTVCSLGVRVGQEGEVRGAGGFILQLMPGANDFITPIIQANIDDMPSLSQLIADGKGADDIFKYVYGEVEYSVLERSELEYKCSCSKEKYAKALLSLGSQELREMRDDGLPAEIVCQFCNKKYVFSTKELDELYNQALEKAKRLSSEENTNEE
jgi:molecular chaperone Hsp33